MKPAVMRHLISLLASILLLCGGFAAAQAPTPGEATAIEDQIAERTRLLEDIQARLEAEVLTSSDLVSLAEVARSVRQESLGASQPINQRLTRGWSTFSAIFDVGDRRSMLLARKYSAFGQLYASLMMGWERSNPC